MEKILISVWDKSQDNTTLLKTILEKKSYFQVEKIQNIHDLTDQSKLLFIIDPINNKLDLKTALQGDTQVIIASNEAVSNFINESPQKGIAKIISYPFKKIEVLSHIYDSLGVLMKSLESKYNLSETFYQVRPKLLKGKSENAPFNIYLKVGAKHLKVLEKGAKNFNKALSIYEEKGAKYFFINQNDYMANRDFIIGPPTLDKTLPKPEQLKSVNEFFSSLVEEVGIGKSSIKVANKLSLDITESLSSNKKDNLLKKFDIQNLESEFIYHHSYLSSLVCSQLASKMEWDSRTVGKKLVSACLFHDLAISDPQIAMQEHFNPNSVDKLDIKTRNLISTHHTVMANILKDHIEVDGDTIQIIKDSHIDYNDKNKVNQLRQLSFAFHLAHSYVVKFIESNFDSNKNNEVIDFVTKTLDCEKHQSIIKAFKECFKS